jgi:glycosyltransferase involved in cell wall biosynthesis
MQALGALGRIQEIIDLPSETVNDVVTKTVPDDLGRAVASMDIFFNPSVTETFGNVTTEAMAAGVPVVAANATGAMDLVADGETGYLVGARDIKGYADALERIATDQALRRRFSGAGQARVADYRWDKVNDAVLHAYRMMFAGR